MQNISWQFCFGHGMNAQVSSSYICPQMFTSMCWVIAAHPHVVQPHGMGQKLLVVPCSSEPVGDAGFSSSW